MKQIYTYALQKEFFNDMHTS